MKNLLMILGGVTAIALLATLYTTMPKQSQLSSDKLAHGRFSAFKAQYSKSYNSVDEHLYRFKVFQDNLELIESHNAKPNETYTLAANEFADLTFAEFKSKYLGYLPSDPSVMAAKCEKNETRSINAPDQVNWSSAGKVQDVKNQGNCGSCWAFSAIGAIESAWAIKNGDDGEIPNLSEQELVDCSNPYGNEGCNGGLMDTSFDYVFEHHINTSKDYPYAARNQPCQTSRLGEGKTTIEGCVKANPTVDGLIEAISLQPVSVAFHVTNTFMFYHGGVYNPLWCWGEPNHGVLAVGYDKTAAKPHFIVKNSWGSSWGEKGYFRIVFGKETGTCKIAGSGANYYPLA